MATPKIVIDRERIAEFCRQHHIRRLQLFGSVLRDDFRPDSDVDVLVEFEPGHTPGWGIIDIEDETQPVLLSKLKLEVHDPANCSQVLNDFAPDIADFESYGYSSHYCSVDRKVEPRMLACGYLGAGLRVFDIRNPREPREIAYYKPGARRLEYRPGSAMWADYKGLDRTTDRVQTNMRFVKYRGETHIQFVSQDGGFQIVRFTKTLRELLGKRSGKAAVDED